MSFQDLLARISKILESAHVPYMLTGSYASSVHGTPRATQDLDIVIAPTRVQLTDLLKFFPDTDYYVSTDAALDAFALRGQFNVIDFSTGWKVDFIILKNREFSRTEFQRRQILQLDDVSVTSHHRKTSSSPSSNGRSSARRHVSSTTPPVSFVSKVPNLTTTTTHDPATAHPNPMDRPVVAAAFLPPASTLQK